MIAVIFEVVPAPGRRQAYAELAAALREHSPADRARAPADRRERHGA